MHDILKVKGKLTKKQQPASVLKHNPGVKKIKSPNTSAQSAWQKNCYNSRERETIVSLKMEKAKWETYIQIPGNLDSRGT